MTNWRRLLLLPVALAATSCAIKWFSQELPTPDSRAPHRTGQFQAGAATVDITPPVGLGLAGASLESPRSTGYRTRLYARALVLEDPTGERIALVVVDLPHVSANLHRLSASRLAPSVGIGADRLIVSATHTHSSFAHFYGERQYNKNGSRVAGYDPRVVEFLVGRITAAVETAANTLTPAVAASGTIPIVGATRNRSLGAFCLNFEPSLRQRCEVEPPEQAVDTMLFMLRVDRLDRTGGRHVPLASYSIFAIHGTGLPTVNTLLDGDIHFRVLRDLSSHVAGLGGGAGVHVLANGNEGDVGPAVLRDPSCSTPRVGSADRFPMPVGPRDAIDFITPAASRAVPCVQRAIREMERVADTVVKGMIRLYDSLGSELTGDIPIRRAFATDRLPGHEGLCEWPELGSAAAAGAEGTETRVRDWRWLVWPVVKLGFEEGGTAVKPRPDRCQAPKRRFLGGVQRALIVGKHGFPEDAQLTVVRIGSALLAAVPAELTSTAGRDLRQEMARASRGTGWTPSQTAVIGLANGFIQYVTTAAEYGWQAYEGGSNLYGPGTAAFLEKRIGQLASTLPASPGAPSPPAIVDPITIYPGAPTPIMPLPGPTGATLGPVGLRCEGGRLTGRWKDLGPGQIFPRDSIWIRLSVQRDGSWVPVAHDGDGDIEIHLDGPAKQANQFRWRAVWLKDSQAGGRYLLERLDSLGASVTGSGRTLCR